MPGSGVFWAPCLQKLLMTPSSNQERWGREATACPSGRGLACKDSGKMERGGVTPVGLGSRLDPAPCRQAPELCGGPPEWTLACPIAAVWS